MHVRKLAGIVIVEGSIIENRNHLPLLLTLLDPRAFPIGNARASTSNYRSLFPPSLLGTVLDGIIHRMEETWNSLSV